MGAGERKEVPRMAANRKASQAWNRCQRSKCSEWNYPFLPVTPASGRLPRRSTAWCERGRKQNYFLWPETGQPRTPLSLVASPWGLSLYRDSRPEGAQRPQLVGGSQETLWGNKECLLGVKSAYQEHNSSSVTGNWKELSSQSLTRYLTFSIYKLGIMTSRYI